jgi:hypothetical protein
MPFHQLLCIRPERAPRLGKNCGAALDFSSGDGPGTERGRSGDGVVPAGSARPVETMAGASGCSDRQWILFGLIGRMAVKCWADTIRYQFTVGDPATWTKILDRRSRHAEVSRNHDLEFPLSAAQAEGF